MDNIPSFKDLVKKSHEQLEREGVGLKVELRDLKHKKRKDNNMEELSETLENLKQLKNPVDDMIKFLEEIKTKITDTEVHIYENMGVVSRGNAGRNPRGQSQDSGVFSTDSRVLTEVEGTPVTQPNEDVRKCQEPTQHEDDSVKLEGEVCSTSSDI